LESSSLIKYLAAKIAAVLEDAGLQPGEQIMTLAAVKRLVG
jgi:hypothetical protein